MNNKKADKPRRSYSVNLYLRPDEEAKLNQIVDYLHVSKNQLVRIFIDYIYETAVMGNSQLDIEEFAYEHDVGYGTLVDIFGEDTWKE